MQYTQYRPFTCGSSLIIYLTIDVPEVRSRVSKPRAFISIWGEGFRSRHISIASAAVNYEGFGCGHGFLPFGL